LPFFFPIRLESLARYPQFFSRHKFVRSIEESICPEWNGVNDGLRSANVETSSTLRVAG
jgi:hypothetical protein